MQGVEAMLYAAPMSIANAGGSMSGFLGTALPRVMDIMHSLLKAWPRLLTKASHTSVQGVEATLYAALMSIANASGSVSELLGAALSKIMGITAHDFKNMAWLVLVCTLSSLLPLPFLGLVPDINEHTHVSTVEH